MYETVAPTPRLVDFDESAYKCRLIKSIQTGCTEGQYRLQSVTFVHFFGDAWLYVALDVGVHIRIIGRKVLGSP